MSAEEKNEMKAPEQENTEKTAEKTAAAQDVKPAEAQVAKPAEAQNAKPAGPQNAKPAEAQDAKPAEASGFKKKPFKRDRKFFGKGDKTGDEFVETVVRINRVAKVVKGGKNFSFSALVVSGDAKGQVGIGFGKSKEIAEAIRKGSVEARKSFSKVNLLGDTIPHEVIGKFKATRVILKPAGAGTGVIAGGPVRALCDAVGIKNILTKSLGSRNSMNVIKATVDGFDKLRLKRRG